MKVKKIDIPIFNHRVTLIAGNLNTVITYLSSVYGENIGNFDMNGDDATALCFNIKGDLYIWWEDQVPTPVLGHEVIHAVYAIIKHRGLDIEDQEITSYLWQYIMEQALSTLRPTQTDPINPQ